MRRTTLTRPLLCLGSAFLAAACFGLGPGPGLISEQAVVREGEALPEFSVAQGLGGTILVTGQIVGRLRCDGIVGELKERGDDLELTVTLIADQSACPGAVPTTWSYVFNIISVKPGPHGITVDYKFQGFDGVAGVRLDTLVTVQ